jgi:hypothetical protein
LSVGRRSARTSLHYDKNKRLARRLYNIFFSPRAFYAYRMIG